MTLFESIRKGDLVTISTPQGQEIKGKAVMKGPYGWVLNMGGRYGKPGVASEKNTVNVKKSNRVVEKQGSFLAQSLVDIAKVFVAKWEPVRRDVDVGMRNKEMLESLTTFAPNMSRILRDFIVKDLSEQDFDIRPNSLKREWSEYVVYQDQKNNNNKYHYYAVYSFTVDDGQQLFIALNCSGRIGIVERIYDLTLKFNAGPSESLNVAKNAAMKHLNSKLAKGYKEVKMRVGSK